MALPLEEFELIKQVKYRYMRAVDMGDTPTMMTVLTSDATTSYSSGAISLSGSEKICKFLTDSLHSRIVSCHTVHHPELKVTSATTAEGTWYLTDRVIDLDAQTILHGAALYHDEYVKIDGEWKIKHTGYDRLYEQLEPLPEGSYLTAHYLAEKAQKS